MKIIIFFTIFIMIISKLAMAAEKKSALDFYLKQSKDDSDKYQFTEYESIYSGIAAFIIGNVGYLTTDSSALKLAYTGIQTIGVINIGHGIYIINSPSVDASLYNFISKTDHKNISKEELARKLIEITAREDRAKRISLFYSTSALAIQYVINATLYDSPGRLKNVYFFMAGVNSIVAAYAALNKSKHENFIFGKDMDLVPFSFFDKKDLHSGLFLSLKY